jgi:hypothetical protein
MRLVALKALLKNLPPAVGNHSAVLCPKQHRGAAVHSLGMMMLARDGQALRE